MIDTTTQSNLDAAMQEVAAAATVHAAARAQVEAERGALADLDAKLKTIVVQELDRPPAPTDPKAKAAHAAEVASAAQLQRDLIPAQAIKAVLVAELESRERAAAEALEVAKSKLPPLELEVAQEKAAAHVAQLKADSEAVIDRAEVAFAALLGAVQDVQQRILKGHGLENDVLERQGSGARSSGWLGSPIGGVHLDDPRLALGELYGLVHSRRRARADAAREELAAAARAEKQAADVEAMLAASALEAAHAASRKARSGYMEPAVFPTPSVPAIVSDGG